MKPIAPIERSKDQARQYYNRISGVYDWLTASEKPLIKKGVQLLSPQPGETLLVIGCGSGTGLKLIQRAVRGSCQLTGLDIAHQMLRESHKKTSAFLVQGDGVDLPFEDKEFDGVFCSFTLELFAEEEIPRVLGEIRRALASNGRLVVVALSSEPNNLAVRVYAGFHKLFPVAVDCRPIPLNQILAQNGFRILEEKQVMNWGLPVRITSSKPA